MSAPTSALDTVASLLRGHPDVVEVATFRTSGGGPARTVAAVVAGPLASVVDLRDHLWDALAPAELPDLLVTVAELPRDATGAVDTGSIEAEALDRPGGATFRAPRTPTEVAIAEVWCQVLGRSRISADDNFLDLGGDSMTAALLLDLTNERLGGDLSLGDLLAAPSLATLAETVGTPGDARGAGQPDGAR